MAVWVFSMSAGLLASTVTPGRMLPVASLTLPEMPAVPCAAAAAGTARHNTIRSERLFDIALLLRGPSSTDRFREPCLRSSSAAISPLGFHPPISLYRVALLIDARLQAVETHLGVDRVPCGRQAARLHQVAQQFCRMNLLFE